MTITLYYFLHGPAYEVVENVEQARKFLAAGWRLVTWGEYKAAWRARDAKSVEDMKPKERTV